MKKRSFLGMHWLAFSHAGKELFRSPVSSLMTALVIAIALSLPTAFYVLIKNVRTATVGWDNHAQISVYLSSSVAQQKVQQLLQQIKEFEQVKAVRYISPAAGLKQFKSESGLGDLVDQLPKNPLPGVILVEPNVDRAMTAFPEAPVTSQSYQLSGLISQLKLLPGVDQVDLDVAWVKKLYALLAVGDRLTIALALLLGLGVLLIICNTLRLMLQATTERIEVYYLIGASHAFIRRPFLYIGLLYGLIGAVFAWMITSCFFYALHGAVTHLAILYQSDYRLLTLSQTETGCLFIASCFLGMLAALIAVKTYLSNNLFKVI